MSSANNMPLTSVAVVGSGYWGKNLVRNFYSLNALKLICDKNDTALNDLKNSILRLTCALLSMKYLTLHI
jgi:hypothetical protein